MAARRASGALLLALCIAGACADKCTGGFSVVAPETAVPGTTSAVLVTLHGHTGSDETLNVTVRLESQDDENRVKLLATATRSITGYGIVSLKIPPAPPGVCTLHTTVGCAGVDECTRRSHSSLRLLGGVRDVVLRPARHHYRPGETVTFWVLALEHELRLVREELVDVALRDPRGTRVSVWDQLSLEEGVRKLSASLSPTAASGTWRLEARCGAVGTSVQLHVSAATPARATSAPPVAEQHSVELRFADTMRRRYKPGLPFVGRVEAVSTERHVRVRVKLYDNETDIYSQDIDMASGEGGFVVPTVLADAPYLYLQAELVAVEGKEIETHYVLARERIKRWNSTARCYLLIDNLPTPLQAGSIGSASVWSSCGCAQRLLAAVTSGGRAVHWATISTASASSHVTASASTSASANRTAADLCRFNYTFPVIADMAPTSSLLVYYVTDQGEPVSDVATIHVRLLHKEVGVSVEERRWWYPHAALQLRVRAPLDSTLCLIGARAAGAGDAKRDQRTPWSDETHERALPDEDTPEFVSAGVSLFVSGGGGSCGGGGGGGVLYRQRRASAARAAAPHDQLLGPDPNDRLWMWKCFNYTKELSSEGVTISAPSEAGRWSVWALSLSSRGLRFSEPASVTVFRPIQLEFSLPPALRVGETVELDVKITNNINNCMDVTALLALSAGAAFASTGMLYVTERLRLGPRGATQLVVRVAVNTPGHKNITVEVTGYSADNCSVSYGSFNNETLVGSVVRSAAVLVQPEGLLRSDTQSAYFCANEHLAVSTRSSWEWQWVSAPRNRAGLVLELRAKGPAHVALSSEQRATPDMYRVVIDGPRVWIARGKHGYDVHLASATQSGEDDECSGGWCAWWVWWEGGRLAVGRGARPHERPLLAWPLAPGAVVRYVGFSALWGDTADFRIWNFNEEAGFSQVLELALPHGVVPGSASGTLLVSGGLHLPVSVTRDQSIESSGERVRDSQLSAAAASLAPLLALEHTPHMVDDNKREEILKNLPEQIQTLLSFRNEDNSFSDHRAMSSHLSTIQILEILSKTQSYYPVDPELLQSIKKWVHSRQDPEGSFAPLPADATIEYYPEETGSQKRESEKDISDYYCDKNNVTKESLGWERNVEVTADTLATLLEIGVENEEDAAVVKKAQIYLERSLYNLTTPAALAFTVYALVLARSPVVSEALKILRNASTTEEGEFGWPSPGHDAADWLLEDSSRNIKQTSYGGARVEQYSATVRVLLAACARGALAEGEAAARYLYYRAPTLRAHPALAYPATKAAAQYAQLAHDRHRALTVSLATAGMELTDTIELRAQSPARLLQLPGLPTKVFVYATGAGCATVQGTITYSTYTARSDNALLSIQSAIIEEIRPERSSLEELQGTLPTLNIKTCFRWKSPQRSAVLRLEVSLFSGYELYSVSPVVLDGGVFADMQHGSRGHFVWFVFANVSSACPVCTTYQVRSHYVISGLRPAFAKIYPSNRPDLAAETFFHARPASSLLKGITDDDYITWFDKTEAASLSSNHSIDNICECGRICGHRDLYALSTTSTTKIEKTYTTSIPFTSKGPEIITKTVKNVFKEVPLNNTTMMPKTKPVIQPIIYPTVSYLNSTNDNQTLENMLVPAIQRSHAGEIIVQKAVLPPVKTVFKKEVKKKPLPRKKGTLKATYGDKHEFFFYKHQPEITPLTIASKIVPTAAEPEITTLKLKTTTSNDSFLVVRNNKLVSNILPHMLRQIATATARGDSETTVSSSSILSQEVASSTTTEVVALKEAVTSSEVVTSTKAPSSSTSKPTILEQSTSAHTETITTIATGLSTQSSQFTTPIPTTESESYIAATKTKKYFLKLNKSKQDDMTRDKYSMKQLKSINKEIHKIPPTPFSETSKTLSSVKEKQAPENRDGFVVLDKNETRMWELLKEEAHPAGTGSAAVESNLHAEPVSQQKSARSL